MKNHLPLLAAAAVALLLFAGCETVDSRIKKKPDVFAKLDPATQDKIKQGIIDIGYTEDMVYLALGAPDQKRESVSEKGKSVTWIYNTYYERYEGTQMVGYHRRVYYDPFIRSYRLYYRPAFADVYSSEKEERIRVVFKDGKASVIEQAKGEY
jgi:hypothetical protein